MGCDIHLHVEKRDSAGWKLVRPPERWSSDKLSVVDHDVREWENAWFHDRNYELFAWLADVRNYHGNTVLSAARGLPDDVSDAVDNEKNRWGADGHSHSWFTVAELVSGLESLTVKDAGYVNEPAYLEWKKSGANYPSSWCGGTSIPTIDEAAYLRGERPDTSRNNEWSRGLFAIGCKWSHPASVAFERFQKLVTEVSKLGEPDAVRIVFWFDN